MLDGNKRDGSDYYQLMIHVGMYDNARMTNTGGDNFAGTKKYRLCGTAQHVVPCGTCGS